MSEGWRCPGCGHCYAPGVAECTYCPADAHVGTCTGDSTEALWKLFDPDTGEVTSIILMPLPTFIPLDKPAEPV